MNTNSYTNVPELSEFFNVQLNQYGEDSCAYSAERMIEYDLKQAALKVSEKWALKKEFTDDDVRELLEVLHGTLNDLHALRQVIVKYIKEHSKEE